MEIETSNPIFSVVTICYNIENEIEDTLKSVMQQSFNSYEHIIIDGASSDKTLSVIEKYKDRYSFKLISEKDNGIYDAMNKGLLWAKGRYIVFINGGDLFVDNSTLNLIYQSIYLQKNLIDFIYGDSFIKEGKILHYRRARHCKYKWYGMFSNHQSMIYKMSIIREHNIKYDLSYKIAADYKFTLEFLNKSKKNIYIDQPLSVFSLGGISDKRRTIGLNEAERARKEVLHYSIMKNKSIRVFLMVAQFIYSYMKPLYNKIRYSK
ncbi:MAG: glycosyltransferase family 2 protein [Dysgonomonas sp.]